MKLSTGAAARCRIMAVALTAVAAMFAGCQHEAQDSTSGVGLERGSCRPPPPPSAKATPEALAAAACNPGLVCLSGLCVRPPAANCPAVGERLASFELGNYAEPEDRAPVVERYRAACEAALLSTVDGACIDQAISLWAARNCAPRMFPPQAASTARDCAAAVAKTQAGLEQQAAYLRDPKADPKLKLWFARTMQVMREACEQDQWPTEAVTCMQGAADPQALGQACNQQLPPELQQKLQARMNAAMQQMMPQLTGQPAP